MPKIFILGEERQRGCEYWSLNNWGEEWGGLLQNKDVSLISCSDGDPGSWWNWKLKRWAFYILKIEDEAGAWFLGLGRGKRMQKTKVWDAHCWPSPLLPSPFSRRAGLLWDATLLKTEVSFATCPKICRSHQLQIKPYPWLCIWGCFINSCSL